MPNVEVVERSGQIRALQASVGATLMEALSGAGVAEPFAICGGVCSCGTCHVYIDQPFAAILPEKGEDEAALLESLPNFEARSRLSCQIRVTSKLEGLRVVIAPDA